MNRTPQPRFSLRESVTRLVCCAIALATSWLTAQGPRSEEDEYSALRTQSPFLRTVTVSDSLVLTGIARIDGNVFVTLVDTQTRQTQLVSENANDQGFQLVSFRGDETDLETLSAKVQIGSGEVLQIRYEQLPPPKMSKGKPGSSSSSSSSSGKLSDSQKRQAKEAAINYRGENPADGYPKLPPKELADKLGRLSVSQRESINRDMLQLRNRGLGMEQRKKIYIEKVNRAAGSR